MSLGEADDDLDPVFRTTDSESRNSSIPPGSGPRSERGSIYDRWQVHEGRARPSHPAECGGRGQDGIVRLLGAVQGSMRRCHEGRRPRRGRGPSGRAGRPRWQRGPFWTHMAGPGAWPSRRHPNRPREPGIRQSMSRRACCRDNACIGSFWGRMEEQIGDTAHLPPRGPWRLPAGTPTATAIAGGRSVQDS
jgi:hypothetical protein